MNSFNFQVSLGGIIDILANHLYSEEKVFVRELLQNSIDSNELSIKVLYVQALLFGHHPLSSKELGILSQGLIEMMFDE